jgi:hypothetical protein
VIYNPLIFCFLQVTFTDVANSSDEEGNTNIILVVDTLISDDTNYLHYILLDLLSLSHYHSLTLDEKEY